MVSIDMKKQAFFNLESATFFTFFPVNFISSTFGPFAALGR